MKTTTNPDPIEDNAAPVADATTPHEVVSDPDPIAAIADATVPKRRGRPPKKAAAAASTDNAAAAGGRPSNQAKLKRSLVDQYTMLGQVLAVFAPATGRAVIERADSCAASLASWADTNATVRRQLERVNSTAGLVGVLMAHGPILFIAYQEMAGGSVPLPSTDEVHPSMFDMWPTPPAGSNLPTFTL